MKRWICALTALCMLLGFAWAEEAAAVRVAFEDGFSLELPAGWKHYAPDAEMQQEGVLYCLSDAEGKNWLYIQSWGADCADIDALNALVDSAADPDTSGVYYFNGVPFVVYDLSQGDVSCCAALLDGRVINFVFTPQSDSAYMITAAQIMASFYLT